MPYPHMCMLQNLNHKFQYTPARRYYCCMLTLTLSRGWWGRYEKNYFPKEEGRENGEKKHVAGGQGSNPGPAAC